MVHYAHMSDIIGHKNILDFFQKVETRGTLSHAYCFTGPEHVGKRAVADFLASRLLKVSREKLFTSPDFSFVTREINEKTEKLRKDISIDQIRRLISHLSSRAYVRDGYKVAIIDHAELLSTGASNALLKTLEKPTEKTILFLITPDEHHLLSTIQSRSQMIHFSLVPQNIVYEYIDTQVSDLDIRELMKKYAYGMPGKVISWIQNPEAFQEYLDEYTRFEQLFGKSFHEKISAVDDLFGDKTDHIMAREHLQDVLSMWHIELHRRIIEYKNVDARIVAIESKIRDAQKLLAQNVHPRLLVEQILLEI
ncbi:MAG: hypothetical protein HYV41_05325 [Candidatus Magasanikbacteria bacterium]|nr:hypothetical protein [Candidatus Magasanikbacteria bacterium]